MNRKENSIIMGKFILSNGTPLTVKNNESVWYTNPIKKLNIFFKNDEMPYCRIVRINFPFYRYIKCGYFTNGSTKLTTLGTFDKTKILMKNYITGQTINKNDIQSFIISVSNTNISPSIKIKLKT